MTTLLIDGDIFVYRSAFGAETTVEFEEGEWATTANLEAAQEDFANRIEALSNKLKADRRVIALSDGANWRKEIYPPYKQQRTKVRKPVLMKPLREFVMAGWETFIRPTLEADDVLGILATSQKIKGRKVIVSIDKDLLQVPGEHFNPDKDNGVVTVTEPLGDFHHLLQTLTGDVVDNYPGCPGVGPVKAHKILTVPPHERWAAIVTAFTKKGLTEHDALVQARIARILRASDYDFGNRCHRLWNPATA